MKKVTKIVLGVILLFFIMGMLGSSNNNNYNPSSTPDTTTSNNNNSNQASVTTSNQATSNQKTGETSVVTPNQSPVSTPNPVVTNSQTEETSVSTTNQTPVSNPNPVVTHSQTLEPSTQSTPAASPQSVITDTKTVANNPGSKLRIGAFNIQVFGQSKASKPEVMDVLAKTIHDYDVIGIQEIRDSSGTSLPSLMSKVNEDGSKYAYVVSDRLGRTTSKEQYAYVYNTKTVQLEGSPEVYPEPSGTDPFQREPYIAHFKAGNFDAE
jgi:hypothetical protein